MRKAAISPIVDFQDDLQDMLATDASFAKAYNGRATARMLASALVGYRMKNDLTQKQLAKVLNMTSSEVSRLENGDHSPSVRTLDHVLAAIGKTVQIVDRKPEIVNVRRSSRPEKAVC